MNQRVLAISAYQGEVDFHRLKQDGIWGVMLKATEGERYPSRSCLHDQRTYLPAR